jgi:hypothetical protein
VDNFKLMRKFVIFILSIISFSAISCTKKQESLAKTEIISSDSLFKGEISDEIIDEFEYEADSLATDQEEDQ